MFFKLNESTNIETDYIIQRYSKRPRQLQNFFLADYLSTVDIKYPKGIHCQRYLKIEMKMILKVTLVMKMLLVKIIVTYFKK